MRKYVQSHYSLNTCQKPNYQKRASSSMPPGGSGRPKNNAGCAPCIHGTESVSGGFCKAAPASEVFLGGTCKTCMKRTKVLLCWNSFRALIKCDIKLVSKVLAKCVPLRVRLILCACIHEYVCICVSV